MKIITSGVSSDSKSGQTFWRSSDGTLVVKTIKGYECQTMRKLLVSYANHVTGNLSCLSGVLGLYRVHMKGKKTYFLITRCVFSKVAMPAMMPRRYYADLAPTDGAFIDRSSQEGSGLRYDLKGSTYGRQKSVSSSVLKDLDLMYSTSGLLKLRHSNKVYYIEFYILISRLYWRAWFCETSSTGYATSRLQFSCGKLSHGLQSARGGGTERCQSLS